MADSLRDQLRAIIEGENPLMAILRKPDEGKREEPEQEAEDEQWSGRS